jgi:hypothetical protein
VYDVPFVAGLNLTVGTWVPVLRIRSYKPRSRVAAGVALKKALTAKSHKY